MYACLTRVRQGYVCLSYSKLLLRTRLRRLVRTVLLLYLISPVLIWSVVASHMIEMPIPLLRQINLPRINLPRQERRVSRLTSHALVTHVRHEKHPFLPGTCTLHHGAIRRHCHYIESSNRTFFHILRSSLDQNKTQNSVM